MGHEQICDFSAAFPRAGVSRASTTTAQCALLKGGVAESKAVADRDAEIAELQRKAIASLQECAEAALQIAGLIEDPTRPSDAVKRYLGQDGYSRAALTQEANAVFEYARSFMLHLAGGERDGGFRRPGPAPAPASSAGFQERLDSLSPSQRRAFDLLVKGLPNKLIAYELGLAESTVKAHMSALFRKLGVRSRTHAIAVAASVERERGLVSEIASGVEISEGGPLCEREAQTAASPPRAPIRSR